jgi:hypothetical protein
MPVLRIQNANLEHLKSPAEDQTSKAEGATFQWKDALTFFTYLNNLHPKHKVDFHVKYDKYDYIFTYKY